MHVFKIKKCIFLSDFSTSLHFLFCWRQIFSAHLCIFILGAFWGVGAGGQGERKFSKNFAVGTVYYYTVVGSSRVSSDDTVT